MQIQKANNCVDNIFNDIYNKNIEFYHLYEKETQRSKLKRGFKLYSCSTISVYSYMFQVDVTLYMLEMKTSIRE